MDARAGWYWESGVLHELASLLASLSICFLRLLLFIWDQNVDDFFPPLSRDHLYLEQASGSEFSA